tara:strand:- start:3747 stop:3953 length:207 start_codon:yes stop_codon:yes gene_type:complete
MNKILTITFVFTFLLNNKAFAYLDPGTGSIILQSILGAIAAGASYCAIYWKKIKNFFNKNLRKKDNKD